MALEDDVAFLSRLEFFRDFTTEQLRLVAFGAQRKQLVAGEELFLQDDLTDGGFVIVEGEVELTTFRQGCSVVIGSFGPGSLIGEMALLSRNRRVGTAIATTNAEVLRVSRAVVRRVIEEYPELAALLYNRISDSVLKTMENIENAEVNVPADI